MTEYRTIARACLERRRVWKRDLGHRTVRQLVKFGCVGAVNTFVDWTTYFVLALLLLRQHWVVAKAIAYSVGILSSYWLNRNWTFYSQARTSVELPRFVLASVASLMANTLLMYLALEHLRVSNVEALVTATVGTFLLNFGMCKKLIFTKRADLRQGARGGERGLTELGEGPTG